MTGRLLIRGELQFHTTRASFFVVLAISIRNNNTVVCKLIGII